MGSFGKKAGEGGDERQEINAITATTSTTAMAVQLYLIHGTPQKYELQLEVSHVLKILMLVCIVINGHSGLNFGCYTTCMYQNISYYC